MTSNLEDRRVTSSGVRIVVFWFALFAVIIGLTVLSANGHRNLIILEGMLGLDHRRTATKPVPDERPERTGDDVPGDGVASAIAVLPVQGREWISLPQRAG